jgi:hypothetical protein
MNRGNPGATAVIAMLMLGGLYAVASVLLTEGNTIGQMSMYLMVGGFLLSLAAPRLGFHIWMIFCGYNDLLKRLLVVGGRVTQEDLKFVLGITPAMFSGVVVALVFSGLMGSRRISGRDWLLLVVGIFLMLLAAAIAVTQSGAGLNGVLQSIANNGLYSLLLFVVPMLLRGKNDLIMLWRTLVITWLPVSIYGVFQQVNGFADFEVEYLLSGLSIEIKQLYTNDVRAFSTLNSATALSIVAAVLAVSSLLLGFMYREQNGRSPIGRVFALFCFVAHFAGLIASTSRSALLILPAALIGTWCFASHVRTKAFYITVIGAFLLLVVSSGWLIEQLDVINEYALALGGSGAFISRMLIVGTYWDRLSGFSNVLMNPKAWSLFGHGAAEDGNGMYHYHDPISEILMRHGIIALVVVLVVLVLMLRWFHKQAWKIKDLRRRQLASAMISIAFSILLVAAISGNVMTVFPVNVFFWLSCAAVLGFYDAAGHLPPTEESSMPVPPPAVGHKQADFRHQSHR